MRPLMHFGALDDIMLPPPPDNPEGPLLSADQGGAQLGARAVSPAGCGDGAGVVVDTNL
jgi:hypothetical protein